MTHEDAAAQWIAQNPVAFGIFESFALQQAREGHRFGVKALAERVRWECRIHYKAEGYKVNNNHVAGIGRELVRRHPELSGFMVFRKTA